MSSIAQIEAWNTWFEQAQTVDIEQVNMEIAENIYYQYYNDWTL